MKSEEGKCGDRASKRCEFTYDIYDKKLVYDIFHKVQTLLPYYEFVGGEPFLNNQMVGFQLLCYGHKMGFVSLLSCLLRFLRLGMILE